MPRGWGLFRDNKGNPIAGRLIVGAGQGVGLASYVSGETGGEEKTTLTFDQMPPHSHRLDADIVYQERAGEYRNIENLDTGPGNRNIAVMPRMETTETGHGESFTVIRPYIALYWCTPEAG